MKQFYTVLAILFFALTANAQFTETFENYNALSSSCWQFTSTQPRTSAPVIEGSASIESLDAETALISTPYLDFTGPGIVSFRYQLNNDLKGSATRVIEIGTTDKNGNFEAAQTISLNKNTSAATEYLFSQNIDFPAGTKRFTIRILSNRGDGNTHVIIDDLSVAAASLHYDPQSCNTAPVATDANFATFSYAPFHGNLSSYASDANTGESLTFSLENLVTSYGTLEVNADGSFVFTPNGDFNGGDIVFTYYVTDDGYDPLRSNTATATITFATRIVLPVHIAGFSGSIVNQKAQLAWSVTQNEDGSAFEVEKSGDGRNFTTLGVVATTQRPGVEQYSFADAQFSGIAYYRLKVINKSGVVSYSKTVMLKEKGDTNTASLTLLQNPVVSSINFTYKAATAGTATVNIYTLSGVKISSARITMHSGMNQATLQAENNMAPGAYILEVVNGSHRNTAKLVKL